MAKTRPAKFFYRTELTVAKNVFRPRPETEQLVDYCREAIAAFWGKRSFSAIEIGTGSGAIAISLAKLFPQARITATDVSIDALRCARANGEKEKVNISWKESDLFIQINQKFNVIVANLPYVAEGFVLPADVTDHDPKLSLFGGAQGLDLFVRFFEQVGRFCQKKFLIALEFGWDQKSALEELIRIHLPETRYNFLQDYQKRDRFLFIHNLI